ncbi:hypothetical protein EXE55_04600 [Burkholderia glumae]|nr:hypothetical protein EXE55_04600 [Burkholderia glumae]
MTCFYSTPSELPTRPTVFFHLTISHPPINWWHIIGGHMIREKIVIKNTIQTWNYLHSSMRAKDPSFASDLDRRLPIAVKKGNLSRVKELIEHGADLHVDDDGPLVLAIRHGYLQIADYLISVGANVEAHDHFPILFCAMEGNLPTLRTLAEYRADIHANSEQALRKAASKGHLPIVRFLVERGAYIHAENDEPIKVSAEGDYVPVVKYLIGHGADPSIPYLYGGERVRSYLEMFHAGTINAYRKMIR